jgi:signal transduction histidine kinase
MNSRRHTLLIVDDEVDVLDSLRHQFHRSYRVLTANSAADAIEVLNGSDVHLILSDQRMPGMTGDEFLSQACRIQPDAIRMLFTGYADIQAVINAVNEGHIFRYILKPWDSNELEGIIRQAAEQYDLLAERRALIAELREANSRLTTANEELAHAGRLKTAFIEVASHEFNTPITLVLGLVDLLRLSQPDRSEGEREILQQISASGRQLARLVTNLLTLCRVDDFRRTLQRIPTDLTDLVAAVIDQVHPFVVARHLHFWTRIDPGLGTFEVDADKIHAVLVNLLTNAIKFTPDGGRIELSVQLSDNDPDWVEIRVEDRGVGIDIETLPHLFQPFVTQVDPSCHSSGDFGFNKRGLGLGLSIAKQFVDMHDGRIGVETIEEGGTRLIVSLPRTAQDAADARAARSENGRGLPPETEETRPVRSAWAGNEFESC